MIMFYEIGVIYKEFFFGVVGFYFVIDVYFFVEVFVDEDDFVVIEVCYV